MKLYTAPYLFCLIFLPMVLFTGNAIDGAAWAAPEQVFQKLAAKKRSNNVYESPTIENFSQLYWALGKLDPENDTHVDNYLMINECDIFSDYSANEFEWKQIRESARSFIKKSKGSFHLRYAVTIPIKLGEYDVEKNRFNILKDYQINGVRRFEVYADDYRRTVCNIDTNRVEGDIEGYPRGLLIELSRLMVLNTLPVDPMTAEDYIEEKMRPYKGLRSSDQDLNAIHSFRDAYIVLKVKLFAYRKETKIPQGIKLAEVLGILEGFDVYSDKARKKLIYTEEYTRKTKNALAKGGLKKLLPPSPMLTTMDKEKPAETEQPNP